MVREELAALSARKGAGGVPTSVFLSTYRLRSAQRANLESELKLPVIDRYNLILQIFQGGISGSKAAQRGSNVASMYYVVVVMVRYVNISQISACKRNRVKIKTVPCYREFRKYFPY